MVKAIFQCHENYDVRMNLLGHAGAGAKGEDLVCAGASALACTLALAVEKLNEQGMLACTPTIILQEGEAEIAAVPKEAFWTEVLMAFWTIQVGIGALAEAFPGNVEMTEVMRVCENWKGEET